MGALAAAVLVALLVYQTVTNRTESHESTYLVRNVLAGAVLVFVARAAGLTWDELGLSPSAVGEGWRWGRLMVLAVAVGTAVAGALHHRVPALRRALADERAELSGPELAFQVFVRIPVGTAMFEELAFRGVLLAVLAEAIPTAGATGVQAIAFGLWHIGPTRLTARINGRTDPDQVRREVAVAVAVTTLGGLGFAALRLVSGSLVAPILAHAAINVFGLLLAAATRPR